MSHIALNAYKVASGGILGYITRIVTDLPRLFPEHEYTIFLSKKLDHLPQYPNTTHVYLSDDSGGRFDRFRWEQFALPRELSSRNVDLLYTFSPFDIYLSKCPTIVRLANMAPFDPLAIQAEKHLFGKMRLYILALFSRLATFTADRILVQSSYAAEILTEERGFRKDKTVGIDRGFEVSDIVSDDSNTSNVEEKYILCVSHIFRYKMLIELVQEYASAFNSDNSLPKLLIAGEDKDKEYAREINEAIAEYNMEEHIIMLGGIPREDLHNLIRGSELSVFSSLVETFPTTLLEQMSLGAVLVVARSGVMPKFCGDSVVYYEPHLAGSLATKFGDMIGNTELSRELSDKAKQRFLELNVTWESAFQKRQALFDEVISEARG